MMGEQFKQSDVPVDFIPAGCKPFAFVEQIEAGFAVIRGFMEPCGTIHIQQIEQL